MTYRDDVAVLETRYLMLDNGDEELDGGLERHALQERRLNEQQHLAEDGRRDRRWSVRVANERRETQSDLFIC